ncbi:MAG: hypothetical protein WA996_13305 [Candidatus Promineifilaceae bacterium]
MSETRKTPSSQNRRGFQVAFVLLAASIGLFLYWPTLQLPLIYDDLLHIRITKGLDLANVWIPTNAFGFYRPLTFLPLLLIKNIFGAYPPELLHGINVAQHAVNAALLVSLSWRLWRRIHWALAAGLLFVLFPFSYQAIAVYGHNVHPATTGLLLAGLHMYLSAIRSQGRAILWWMATAILFLLGLLSHESAILFGALAALVHWNDQGQLPELNLRKPASLVRRLARWPWFLFLVAGLIYGIGYQFLNLSRAPQASFSAGASWYKFLYLGQGAAYPITWFGRWLPDVEPAAAGLVLAGLAVMIALTLLSGRDRENRLPLLLGWGWWALASLLIAIPLETSYLLHGPRLLYLSSVGLALLWPVLLEPIYKITKHGRLVWGAILLVILVSNWFYIRERLDDYSQLTAPVAMVEEVMKNKPAAEAVLLVNLPQWIDRLDNNYRVGVDLVAMMGDYLFVEELIGENLQVDRPVRAFLVPDLLANPDYSYGVHEQSSGERAVSEWAAEGSHVFITSYPDEGIRTRYAGQIAPADDAANPAANIGPYDLLEAFAQRCDGLMELTTTWRLTSESGTDLPVPPTTSIFVQYIDNNGQIIDQRDGPLLTLGPDFLNLSPGWLVTDRRELSVTEGQSGQILIGVYDYASGERYQAWDRSGIRLADDAIPVPLQDCS